MARLRMALSLLVMVPAWAVLGGFARLDAPAAGGVAAGMIVGGARRDEQAASCSGMMLLNPPRIGVIISGDHRP